MRTRSAKLRRTVHWAAATSTGASSARRVKPCLPAIAGAERKHPVQFINIWPFAVSSRALIGAARPNPSVEARPNGGAPGPGHGYGVHFPWPGPGTPPSVPPHLKR